MSSTNISNEKSAVSNVIADMFAAKLEGKKVIENNPKPPHSGPITYVITELASNTKKLSSKYGGQKANYVIAKLEGDETSVIKLDPNQVMELVEEGKVGTMVLEREHDSPFKTSATDGQVTTAGGDEAGDQEALKQELTDEQNGATESETKTEAAPEAKKGRQPNPEAEKKKAEKLAAKQKREAEAKAREDAKEAEKKARADKKEAKAASSGKVKALTIFRSEPMEGETTHRSRVMAKFRAPESEGGMGWSKEHANTYYQNCKGLWAEYKLPTAEQNEVAAANPGEQQPAE